MPTLTVETQADAFRLRCPRGHQVSPTNEHWYCRQCAQAWQDDEVEPELDECIDAKTGQRLRRDDVDLDYDVPGVYS